MLFVILTADGVRIELVCVTVPNRVDRSNRYRDIAIFQFSRWQPSAMLDFQKFVILMADRVKRVKMRHCAKLRCFASGPWHVGVKLQGAH